MNKIVDGKYTFEIVDYVPYGYEIWKVGKNMIDGYLPLVQVDEEYSINTETMKAIKIEGSQKILAVVTHGQDTIKKMETYIKRYQNSKRKCTQIHVERLKEALKVMYTIDWRN